MMSTKMKAFVGVSPLCLGRAIVPRPHLYWSGYETTCSRGPALLKQSCQLELFCLLDASTTLISQQKDKLIQANKVLCEVYTMSRRGFRLCPQCGAYVIMPITISKRASFPDHISQCKAAYTPLLLKRHLPLEKKLQCFLSTSLAI